VDAVTGNYKLQPPTSRRSLDEEEVTFASYLQRAGYVTAHYGKWHIGGGGPEKKGYDESDGDIGNEASGKYKDRNPVDIVGMTERAKVFIDKAVEKKQPFFIQMSYLALHSPENASQKNMVKFSELYPDKRIRSVQRIALTADLDEGVGVLLDYLEKMKMVDNTYVIYMSDNGANGNGGVGESVLRGSKGSVYEGGIRAVFIVRGPKVPENSWSAERVVGFDLFPTFCRLAGVTEDLPKNLEGGDLSGLFHGGKGQVVRSSAAMLFHFPHYQSAPPMSALYYENYKLMKDYETGKLELFDIDSDLDESDDLALKEPKKLMMMEKMLEGCLSATGTGLPSVNTEYDASKPTESAGKGKKGSRGSRGGGLRNR